MTTIRLERTNFTAAKTSDAIKKADLTWQGYSRVHRAEARTMADALYEQRCRLASFTHPMEKAIADHKDVVRLARVAQETLLNAMMSAWYLGASSQKTRIARPTRQSGFDFGAQAKQMVAHLETLRSPEAKAIGSAVVTASRNADAVTRAFIRSRDALRALDDAWTECFDRLYLQIRMGRAVQTAFGFAVPPTTRKPRPKKSHRQRSRPLSSSRVEPEPRGAEDAETETDEPKALH